MCEAKAATDDAAVSKERADVFGARARRDVEIFGVKAEEQIADAATDQIRLKTMTLETTNDFCRIRVDGRLFQKCVVTHEPGARVTLCNASNLIRGVATRLDTERRKIRRSRKLFLQDDRDPTSRNHSPQRAIAKRRIFPSKLSNVHELCRMC